MPASPFMIGWASQEQIDAVIVVLYFGIYYHDKLAVMQQGIMFAQAFCFAADCFVVLQVQ